MAFTDEQKAEITAIMTEALGPALKPIQDEFTKMVSGAVAKATKTIEGKIPQVPDKDSLAALIREQLEAARAAGGEQVDPAKGGQQAQQPAKPDPEMLKMREELESIKKDRERLAKEAKEKEERHAREEEESALAQALGPHVKQSPAVVEAAKLLLLKRGVVVRDDKGNVAYKATRKSGGNEYDELLPLADGVKEWAGTTEAQDFLPPKDSGGSGDPRGGKRPAGGGGSNEAARNGFFANLRG